MTYIQSRLSVPGNKLSKGLFVASNFPPLSIVAFMLLGLATSLLVAMLSTDAFVWAILHAE